MKKVTITALKRSIKHWGNNVKAEDPSQAKADSGHCALCIRFARRGSVEGYCEYRGEKCPVFLKTGATGCSKSPWETAQRALSTWKYNTESPSAKSEWVASATDELNFLKSLLPKEHNNGRCIQ